MSSTMDALEHRMVRLGASAQRHTVKAIVFYGRRGTVQMLNCYLERNLRRNGGLLSEVLAMLFQRLILASRPFCRDDDMRPAKRPHHRKKHLGYAQLQSLLAWGLPASNPFAVLHGLMTV